MAETELNEAPVRELTARLAEQLSRLARAEIALARAELFANARQAVLGGGLLGTAGAVGYAALLVFAGAAVAGIAVALPVWASALIVGAALGAVAGLLALLGKARLARGLPPLPMTLASVRRELDELTGRNGQR